MPKSATPGTFELFFSTAVEDTKGFSVGAEGEYDDGPKYVVNDRLLDLQRNRHLYQR